MPKADAQESTGAKDALLGAAAELIAEVGWGRVSSRMVAERAGLNNALVHYHFDSMDDLLRRAAKRVLQQAFVAPTREVWRRRDLAGGMRAAVRWINDLDVEEVETAVLVESLVRCRHDPELRDHAAAGLEALRSELTRALDRADDELAAAGSRGTAIVLLALLDGLLLHRIVDPALDLRPAAGALRSLLAPPVRGAVA